MSSSSLVVASSTTATEREIAIFWDYENVPLPSWCKAADASKAIVHAVSKYGRIVDRRLYFDFSQQGGNLLWSALDSTGLDLVNTPHRNKKETLDKKLIADVLTFAWDSAVRNGCKPCVVLLTSDGDYAYTLSKLRDRGIMSVVMYGKDCSVANVLTSSADVLMSFEEDVLKKSVPQATTSTVSPPVGDDDSVMLCRAVSKVKTENGWLAGGRVGVCFKNVINVNGEELSDRFRNARDQAIANGWMEKGRRRLSGIDKDTIIIVPSDYTGSGETDNLSMEDFLRLTPVGKLAASGDSEATTPISSSTNLFLKNVSSSARVQDLVSYLESKHGVLVQRAIVEQSSPKFPFCFAYVRVETSEQASQLLRLADASKLVLKGRRIIATYDKNVPTNFRRDPAYFYERKSVAFSNSTNANVSSDVRDLCKTLSSIKSQDGWVEGGIAASTFRTTIGFSPNSEVGKERFKVARAQAVSNNLLEVGRRKLHDSSENVQVVSKDVKASDTFSSEIYMRLTQKGREMAEPSSYIAGHKQATSNLFLRNLPVPTHVRDLVKFLEDTHECPIRRATIQHAHSKASVCFAHVEFKDEQDATKILLLAKSGDPRTPGLIFRGKAIWAAPDQKIPKGTMRGDPALVYECSGTLLAAPSDPNANRSVELQMPSTIDGSEASQRWGGLSLSDEAMFCSVMYQSHAGLSKGSCGDWMQSGIVGQNFHHTVRLPTNEASNERYRSARDQAISKGLVEMGRRKLESARGEKEIVAAPRFAGWAAASNLSSETYLRLTAQGILLVEESLPSEELEKTREMDTDSEERLTETNLYLRNLPTSSRIEDFVLFLESTYGVHILRGCIMAARTQAQFSCAHIEFQDKEDAGKILQVTQGSGLQYGGRFIYGFPDEKIPNWTECDPTAFYESSNIYFKSIASGEANDDAPQNPEQEETLETTNLLFGENLALLYAQSQLLGGTNDHSALESSTWNGSTDGLLNCESESVSSALLSSPSPKLVGYSAWNGSMDGGLNSYDQTPPTVALSSPSPTHEGCAALDATIAVADISDSEALDLPMAGLSTRLPTHGGYSAWNGIIDVVDISDSATLPAAAFSTPSPTHSGCSALNGTMDVDDINDNEALITPSPTQEGRTACNGTMDAFENSDSDTAQTATLSNSSPTHEDWSPLKEANRVVENSDNENQQTAAMPTLSPTQDDDGQSPSLEVVDLLW